MILEQGDWIRYSKVRVPEKGHESKCTGGRGLEKGYLSKDIGANGLE